MSSNPCMDGLRARRPLNGRPTGCVWLFWPHGQSPVCVGLSLLPVFYMPALCDAKQCCSLRFVALY